MWNRLLGGIYLLAALVTILVGLIGIHQYSDSALGKPLMNLFGPRGSMVSGKQ